uniref:Apocytochrome f n=1 Tax=Lygus hesperus TaxID=30085 RepID=A0A0A9YD08_LYGHE
MTAGCFGHYDLLYETCRRAPGKHADDAFNVDLPESQKRTDLRVEVAAVRFTPIRHTDPALDKWAEYLKNILPKKEYCENLCHLQKGVRKIYKLILAGHRYLRRSLPDAQDYTNQMVTLPASEYERNGMNTSMEIEPSSRSADILSTKSMDDDHMNKSVPDVTEYVIIDIDKVTVVTQSSMPADHDAPNNINISRVQSAGTYHERQLRGTAGFGIWLALSLFLIFILTAIPATVRYIRKRVRYDEPEITQGLIIKRRRCSSTEMHEL